MSERLKWKEIGSGLTAKSFLIESSGDDYMLKKNGGFVAVFATQKSCKKVAQCIWRELGVSREFPTGNGD